MNKLGADFEFQDVDPKDRQQLEACAAIATAIKKLMAEMVASLDGTIGERLPKSIGGPISESVRTALIAGLSNDTLRGAAEAWAIGAGTAKGIPTTKKSPRASTRERPLAFSPGGAWVRDDASLSIRYRPSG